MTSTTAGTASDLAIASVEEQFGVLFNRVRALWKDHATSVHPALQPAGYKILATLVRWGPAHSGELADLLVMDKSVVSRQVRCMEGLGLVEVRQDPADGRARILAATPDAAARFDVQRTANQEELRDRLRQWTPDEIATLAALMRRLTD